jgi:hypothetical protein
MIRHGALHDRRGLCSAGQVHDLSRRPRVMAERRTSLWEDPWNSDGSRGPELGIERAEAGDVAKDRLTDEASASEGDGRFSAWLMRVSHRTAGSLSSITRTLRR